MSSINTQAIKGTGSVLASAFKFGMKIVSKNPAVTKAVGAAVAATAVTFAAGKAVKGFFKGRTAKAEASQAKVEKFTLGTKRTVALMKLQKGVKTHLEAKAEAATKFQSVVRGHNARKLVSAEAKAAVVEKRVAILRSAVRRFKAAGNQPAERAAAEGKVRVRRPEANIIPTLKGVRAVMQLQGAYRARRADLVQVHVTLQNQLNGINSLEARIAGNFGNGTSVPAHNELRRANKALKSKLEEVNANIKAKGHQFAFARKGDKIVQVSAETISADQSTSLDTTTAAFGAQRPAPTVKVDLLNRRIEAARELGNLTHKINLCRMFLSTVKPGNPLSDKGIEEKKQELADLEKALASFHATYG